MTKKSNYQAWSISENDFPAEGTLEQKIYFLVQYGVLAPSTHNTQPWSIFIKDRRLTITPDLSKALPEGDPNGTGLCISMGTFVENVIQAANAYGLSTKTQISNDRVVVSFQTTKRVMMINQQILRPIVNRCSNKFLYKSVQKAESQKLHKKLQVLQNPYLRVIHNDSMKNQIIQIHSSASQEAIQSKNFVSELSRWLRTNTTKRFDGMPGFVQGHGKIKSLFGKTLTHTFKKLPMSIINYEKILLESSSYFVIIGSKSHQPADIIRAGMLVERFWLAITEEGLVAQPLFAMIRSENHRLKLKKSVGMTTIPVFFFRVGTPTVSAEHTPRRPFPWN